MSQESIPMPVMPMAMPVLPWEGETSESAPLTDAEKEALMEEVRMMRHPLREQLMAQEITPETVVPKREFIFTMFGKPCFPKGELVAITGKAKSGKTFLCSGLMTAAVGGECLGLHCLLNTPQRVLWIDTEQSEESTQDILVNRIHAQLPSTLPTESRDGVLRVYNLRAINWDQRLSFIEAAIDIHQPDLVIFDGIRDVVSDINDGVMAQQVLERLMRLAEKGSCIACVLHQNKAVEDSTLRGALGAELGNKCFEAYECKKLEGIFSVEQTATRKYDIREKLYFTVAATGLPVMENNTGSAVTLQQQNVSGEQPAKRGYFYRDERGQTRTNYAALMNDCLRYGGKSHEDLIYDMMQRLHTDKQSWCENLIQKSLEDGLIVFLSGLYAMRTHA